MTVNLPLAGVRIVDFGIGGVGPWAGSTLAQLGATVLKIEAPNDFLHELHPLWPGGATTTYRALNVGKRSAILNLKEQDAHDVVWPLLESADVMIENFRAGAMERLGFGFEAARARNPRIVYITSNGYGSTGEMAGLPCTDPHMQAFSGYSSLNGRHPAGERLRFYGSIDLFTSGLLVEAALAGMVLARRTGEAQRVEISMIAGATTAMLTRLVAAGSGDRSHTFAPDGFYKAKDRWLAISVPDDETFAALAEALGRSDLSTDPRFAEAAERLKHTEALDAAIAARIAEFPAEWWLVALRRAAVPSAPLHSDYELRAHREAWSRGLLRGTDDPPTATADASVVAGTPWTFDGIPQEPARMPWLGRDKELLTGSADEVWARLANPTGPG